MRVWPVPVQMVEDEKIIGGMMSLRQLGYLILGFCLGGGWAALPLPFSLRIAVFTAAFAFGAALAFVNIYDMPLDVFLWRLIRWWRSPRELYLRGDE